MQMRMCGISYYLYQHRGHSTHSNCHTYTHLKRTYILTPKALRQNSHLIYILNICYLQTTYICLKYISYKFLLFHSHLFILASYLHYAHTCIQKGNSVLSYIYLGSDLNIHSPFAKNFMPLLFTYIYILLQGIFHIT